MFSPLIRKLGRGADLTQADHDRLTSLARTRCVGARQDIIEQGDRPEDVHLVLSGFACRYKIMRNGKRQIMALLVPGDFCDLHVAILGHMDHGIATVSPCTLAELPPTTVLDLTENHPRIARALWWATLVDEAILREWLVSMGQREADQQLAHLFCELLMRLRVAGVADADGYDLPLAQHDLGEVLGITPVHVNRTVQALRAAELIVLRGRRLDIPDVERLKAFCDFDPDYLHLVQRIA
ncbi:Crp/Fnr family transcriptional regulator [Methylobacterium sp. NEAU 140]|uniref:Crp/Fnr family transcriptional regulator n=1 Tax=Methylobacterium sp. NEAU 140 TaxID=3064945 RepID=UPI002734EE06|nr:Crp/Fnr family transcriptional regulator [Methylobacterium sp. NEAU 140]MDP4027200.1 Crp/Fnr family transcriptional regulator [Methylobacterium sp. NEAU 140]